MIETSNPISVAILVLLTIISLILTGYLSLYCYAHLKMKEEKHWKVDDLIQGHWLDTERKPLIPGNFHTETIQPLHPHLNQSDDDSLDETDLPFKERDYSKMGRIIFVMRYNKKREELMVRLVQIEGIPVSQEIYSPNSAYIDVQLKYTGNHGDSSKPREVHKPPRLDICLQEVYYFLISTQQMMSHSLEFRINTFDDQFRRSVSGMVEVDLSEEIGDDILTGSEIVFVKEILEPLLVTEEDDSVSAVSEYFDDQIIQSDKQEEEEEQATRPTSPGSNMSWEPEELSLSTNSLYFRCASECDFPENVLTRCNRSHSVGYLATTEWTVKDISLDDDPNIADTALSPTDLNLPLIARTIDPTPESFYHIVPVTPLFLPEMSKTDTDVTSHRRIAYKKHPKRKQLAHSLARKCSTPKYTIQKHKNVIKLDRSSSWPSLHLPEESSSEVTPEHKLLN